VSSQNLHTILEQASMKLNSTHFASPPMATLGKSSVKKDHTVGDDRPILQATACYIVFKVAL